MSDSELFPIPASLLATWDRLFKDAARARDRVKEIERKLNSVPNSLAIESRQELERDLRIALARADAVGRRIANFCQIR